MLRTLTEGWYLCCYKYRRRHLNYIQIFSWKIMWTFTLTQPVLMCLHFNGPPFPLKYKLNNWIHPMNIRCKRKILVKRNTIIELLRTLSHGSWCLQKDLISPFVDLFMLIFVEFDHFVFLALRRLIPGSDLLKYKQPTN